MPLLCEKPPECGGGQKRWRKRTGALDGRIQHELWNRLDNPNRSGIDWDSSSPNAFLLFLEKDDDASFVDDESPFLTGRWADDDDDMQSFFLLKAEDDDDKSVGGVG